MSRNHAGALCAGLTVMMCGTAMAQPVETITFSVVWDLASITTGSNTGAVYANITPAVGTQTAWNSAPGKGQAATLMAFASSIIDFVPLAGNHPGTLTWSVPANMNLAGLPGTPDGNGGIKGSQAGQFGPPANPNPVVDDKVKILDFKWTISGPAQPNLFVGYKTQASSAKVYLDVGLAAWVGEKAVIVDGSGSFQVPGPAALAVAGMAGIVASRRRRS